MDTNSFAWRWLGALFVVLFPFVVVGIPVFTVYVAVSLLSGSLSRGLVACALATLIWGSAVIAWVGGSGGR